MTNFNAFCVETSQLNGWKENDAVLKR